VLVSNVKDLRLNILKRGKVTRTLPSFLAITSCTLPTIMLSSI
jgi:hypothetical protein